MGRKRHLRRVADDSSSEDEEESQSENDSQEDEGVNDLVDLEAAEATSDASSETFDLSFISPHSSFSKFLLLPPELRQRVWELFCPDLVANVSRVLSFVLHPTSRRNLSSGNATSRESSTARDGMALQDQTESLRALSAVHRESRALAIRRFPDTLSIDCGSGDALVRFDPLRDVAHIVDSPGGGASDRVYHLPGFAEKLAVAAVSLFSSVRDEEAVPRLLRSLSNLKTLFFCADSGNFVRREIRWCASDHAKKYLVETFQKSEGLGEDTQTLYCWPDLEDHNGFAQAHVSRKLDRVLPETIADVARTLDVKVWPMVTFEDSRLQYYDTLYMRRHEPLDDGNSEDDSSSGESEGDMSAGEYESEGIDDSEIVEIIDSSEDELIPDPISPGGHTSEVEETSLQNGDGANFSSPEPERTRRRLKRRAVSDSDSGSEEEGPSIKRVRVASTLSAGSEEKDEGDTSPAVGRRGHRGPVVQISDRESDEDGESDASDSSEDAPNPGGRISLAERLRMGRKDNPVPVDDDSDNAESDDERTANPSDESEEDEDEEEEEESENDLIDGMAAESGSDEMSADEDDDDGW